MNRVEDGCVSLLAVALVGALGWQVLAGDRPAAPVVPATPGVVDFADSEIEARVRAIAEAIAVADGYYVAGEHDGRSLLYRLNNPGGLKKPALAAEDLPTWLDTGLVIFPTRPMGWAALHHQVHVMLTGRSRIYHPSDTLIAVGLKYADGDARWGANVATNLGVSPAVRLGELAGAPLIRDE
jgi:hypothetical protein